MRLYATVSVTGTHGKTTTTSLIAHIFNAAGLDPTVITGGIINEWGSNARLGNGKWMIVEADESDGTFIKIPTQIGVVTNIDPEHLDYFKTVENMHREFETFFRNIPFYGLAVACIDHPVVAEMIERLELRRDGRRLLTYGTSPAADLVLKSARVEGAVTFFDADLGARVRGGARDARGLERAACPAQHNALNALAAIAAASEAGIGDDVIRKAIAGFSGVKRRFQLTGTWNGVAIYDDYGHHPVEIAAVLKAARAGARGRVIAVVEPHRYTRVRDLFARVRRLLQGCRQRHRHAALLGGRAADRRHRPQPRWRRRSAPRATAPSPPSTASARSPRRSSASPRPATWSSAWAPATAPNGRTRFPTGSPASPSAPGAPHDARAALRPAPPASGIACATAPRTRPSPPPASKARLRREEGGGRCVRGLDRPSPTGPHMRGRSKPLDASGGGERRARDRHPT